MAVSDKTIKQAEQTGKSGGTVSTTGMPSSDKQAIDAAVARGQGRK